METRKGVELLRHTLGSVKEPFVEAVLLFGSMARAESGERSNVDLLVLHEGCGIKDTVLRRRQLYILLRGAIGDEFEGLTVVDMEFNDFLKPKEIGSLLLNIYWDAIVICDKTGAVEGFLADVKKGILKSGLKKG